MIRFNDIRFAHKQITEAGFPTVTLRAVRADWDRRKQWQTQVLRLDDSENLRAEIIAGVKDCITQAYRIFIKCDAANDNNGAVGALRTAITGYDKLTNMLVTQGLLQKTDLSINQTNITNITTNNVSTNADLIRDTLSRYSEAFERAFRRDISAYGNKQQMDTDQPPSNVT